ENVAAEDSPALFVDYGHSPDAFAQTLRAVRAVTPGRVVIVFGAPGDRDRLKRPAMAQPAVAGADAVVITDHHPRSGDPAAVRAERLAAARAAGPDREILETVPPAAAIRAAIAMAQGPQDSILWAGPGHLGYREVAGVKTSYDARADA